MVVTEIHNICQKQIFNKRDIGTDNKVVKYSVVRVKTILKNEEFELDEKLCKVDYSPRYYDLI